MINSKKQAVKKEEEKKELDAETLMFNALMVRTTQDEMDKLVRQNKSKQRQRKNRSRRHSQVSESD
jgi:hypothetical protein